MTFTEIWHEFIYTFQGLAGSVEAFAEDVIIFIFKPVGEVLEHTLGDIDIPDWVLEVIFPLVEDVSLWDLMIGTALTVFLGYSFVKWIVGIVTGS